MIKKKPSEFMSREDRLNWLMDEYGDSIVRLAYTYTKQKQMAEDIAQDVFIKCYEKLDTFREESSYRTWLYRITVNTCKDALKSWSYRNLFFTDIISPKWLRPHRSTEIEIVVDEESRMISEKVLALPVKLREVIILHYYEELSTEEVAQLLKLNQNTVKSRLYRGRLQLKKMLDGGERYGR
ncbi:sigma-70 family RNA polymerase sigma factor [Pseudalkalibacillus sp. SCS-8]|uniref:sigma-70 family RNA polymerase sigma factor n=1 Tax=Pseudalkalibacillus nanhaiensis TaxID=3115291 RepID=UPI0032D9EF21